MIINSYIFAIAPIFNSGPSETRLGQTTVSVAGSINMNGNVYAKVYADGASAPTSAAVKAGADGSVLGSAYFRIDLSGLTTDTDYDIYVVAETTGGKLQSSPTKVDVHTQVDLQTTYGSDLIMLLDSRMAAGKTMIGDYGQTVDDVTTQESGSPVTFDAVSNTSAQHVNWNGKSFGFWQSALVAPTKSKLNIVHNGSAFTMTFLACRPLFTNTTDILAIVSTNNITTSKTGFSVTYDNRTASSRTHALVFNVTKSSVGNSLVNIVSNNFFTSSAWFTVTIEFDGTTYSLYKNGSLVTSAAAANTPHSASNASDDLSVGRLSTGGASNFTRVGNIVVVGGTTSSGKRGVLETYVSRGNTTWGNCGVAKVYSVMGQSNASGTATSPPTYLQSQMTAGGLHRTLPNMNSDLYIRKLQFGTNTNTENSLTFGPELEMMYRLSIAYPDVCFLAKLGVSATPLYVDAGGQDWNVTSADLSAQSVVMLQGAIWNLMSGLDRSVEWRGYVWAQGEADALNGNANYKTDWYALFKLQIDVFKGISISTSKLRVLLSLTDSPYTSPTRPFAANITADMNAIALDFATDNPTYASDFQNISTFSKSNTTTYPMSDGTHLNATAQINVGNMAATQFITHIND